MLRTSTAGLTAGVEAGDDRTMGIHDLGLPVYSKTTIGIEHPNPCCSRVEGRGVDPMQNWLLKIFVHAFVRKRVVPCYRLLQVLQRHLLMGMPHDLLGELRKGIGFVEVPVWRAGDVGVAKVPTSPRCRGGIKERPNRSRGASGGPRTLFH